MNSRSREDQHYPTRPVDREKAENELSHNIKKATSSEETAPKQKHVRSIIVYTHDYHSSQHVWAGLRAQPIFNDDIQTFKALVVVHKVLQEGHKSTLREAQHQKSWLQSCARSSGNDGSRGFGSLIRAYVSFIMAKLKFHDMHPDYDGLFEYKEYLTLKGVDQLDEGYEIISDLMNLQDQIETFQKLIFNNFKGSSNNETRISALVPLVKESYHIYLFMKSMLRALHEKTNSADALEELRVRFNKQHFSLRKFYYECSNLRFLTSLINVPKLSTDPPNLYSERQDSPAPREPSRRKPSPPPVSDAPIVDLAEQAKMLQGYEAQQAQLAAQRRAEQENAFAAQLQSQREFEENQKQQALREQQEREQLLQQQMQQHQMGRAAQLEQEMLAMRGQYERDQMLLHQYDNRVKALESEVAAINNSVNAQLSSKDDLLRSLQDQANLWREKYDALAKLYAQLRTEHMDLISKFKNAQLKANSAQEAIDRMERMEREAKTKQLELADMLRERDRARFEVERLKATQKEEIERLQRDLRFANERAEDATRSKSSEVSSVLSKYNKQITELEDALRLKSAQYDQLQHQLDEKDADIEQIRAEKDQELEIERMGMEQTIQKLRDMQMNQGENDEAVNAQIDLLIVDNDKRFKAVLDAIFKACIQKVDDGLYELESPLASGNQTATPEFAQSMVEKASTAANDFASMYSLFIDSQGGDSHIGVIETANLLSQTLYEVLLSIKGITRFASNDDTSDKLIRVAKSAGDMGARFFLNLQSYRLQSVPVDQRSMVIAKNNADTRQALSNLSDAIESCVPKTKASFTKNSDIGDVVEREMMNAASAIEAATNRLQSLLSRPKDTSKYSAIDLTVHDAILQASMSITKAIGGLIKAATDSQKEIVAEGKGSASAQSFYKKNNRWTEGLISAAKAVAFATNLLIDSADGVISGTHSLEQLIVASNEVAAATAQLVAASRVKASLMSKTQERLERAAKSVTDACRALVRQVKTITASQLDNEKSEDYSQMASHAFKKAEMESQVRILELERDLQAARRKLGELRRAGYHTEADTV